jgi:hypothetical protein
MDARMPHRIAYWLMAVGSRTASIRSASIGARGASEQRTVDSNAAASQQTPGLSTTLDKQRLLFSELDGHLASMALFKVNTRLREPEVVLLIATGQLQPFSEGFAISIKPTLPGAHLERVLGCSGRGIVRYR